MFPYFWYILHNVSELHIDGRIKMNGNSIVNEDINENNQTFGILVLKVTSTKSEVVNRSLECDLEYNLRRYRWK